MLALPLAVIALWRAGLVRWEGFVAVPAGCAAFMLSNVMWWGCVTTAVCFTCSPWRSRRHARSRRA